MNVKRVIAREGLVVIGFVVLSAVLIFISDHFPPLPKEAHGKYLVSTEGDHHYLVPAENPANKNKNEIASESTKTEIELAKEELSKREFAKQELAKKKALTYEEFLKLRREGHSIEALVDTIDVTQLVRVQNRIRNFGFFLLFAGYPFYLLIRFIFWAIGTLKQKE